MHIHIIKCCRRLCFRIHSMPENISLLLFLSHSLFMFFCIVYMYIQKCSSLSLCPFFFDVWILISVYASVDQHIHISTYTEYAYMGH